MTAYKVNHSPHTLYTFFSLSLLPAVVSKPMIVFGKAERDPAAMIWLCQKRELRIRPMIVQYLLLPALSNFASLRNTGKGDPVCFN